MDYIAGLRAQIGHQPILMVGAILLVVDSQQRLLMLKRSDSESWGLPGGAMEPGESAEAAAKRETREESNLVVDDMSLFGVFSGSEFYYVYPNGDEVHNVSIVYVSRNWYGEVQLNDEHTEWRWYGADDLPQDLSLPIKPIVDQFKRTFWSFEG